MPVKTSVFTLDGGKDTKAEPKEQFFVVPRLLGSPEPAPSLPGRLCVVGAPAIQWRLVERSDTKNDRVELVAFDAGAAAREQKRSFAKLPFVQHGGKSCAPIVDAGDGFDDNRRSRTILVKRVCGC